MDKYALKPHDALHVACMVSNNIPVMITEDTGFKAIKEIEALTFSQFLARISVCIMLNNLNLFLQGFLLKGRVVGKKG